MRHHAQTLQGATRDDLGAGAVAFGAVLLAALAIRVRGTPGSEWSLQS